MQDMLKYMLMSRYLYVWVIILQYLLSMDVTFINIQCIK